MIYEREIEFRRRKFAQIWASFPPGDGEHFLSDTAPRRHEIMQTLAEFRSTRDVEVFRQTLHGYSSKAGFNGSFSGFNFGVAMFLNQMAKKVEEPSELTGFLLASMEVPKNDQEADGRIADLVGQVELVKDGASPAPKSAGTFCSFFWWLQEPELWPFVRPGCEDALRALGWLPKDLDPVSHYREYRAVIRSLAKDPESVGLPAPGTVGAYTGIAAIDTALVWFNENQWLGLDEALGDRLQWASELNDQRVDGEYPGDIHEVARTNISAVLAEMRILGTVCESPASDALGRSLRLGVSRDYLNKTHGQFRSNAFVKWRLKDSEAWHHAPALLLCVDAQGVALGLSPGRLGQGWAMSIGDQLSSLTPPGMETIANWADPMGQEDEPPSGDYLVGVRLGLGEALGHTDLVGEVIRVAAALQPAMDCVVALAKAERKAVGGGGSEAGVHPDEAEFEELDPVDEGEELEERLDALVDECHLDGRAFVDDLVELLRDKRQIVLYGPPGTGKTYIARKLAEALAPSAECRRFVQFHPSTSYEDFFEGYRPSTDSGGNLSYTLEQGPFASLVEHATEDSERRHLLTIDELNRANVPKVFGELLFLLEYRNESVVPLYRPDGFSVPENVWVIATMNTADRSIAMLDAALRRRFHFVPVFPDTEPVAGILERYLKREGGEVAWASLLEMVNTDLRERLGNGDQLIGPSHFMRPDLDEAHMKRIWEYNVEPLIDDLFYGDSDAIRSFKWAQVLNRFQKSPAGGAEPTATV